MRVVTVFEVIYSHATFSLCGQPEPPPPAQSTHRTEQRRKDWQRYDNVNQVDNNLV